LDEAENVVDEQQHVAVLVVSEILGHRQGCMPHPESGARRLVHLAEDHHHVGEHAGFLHLAIEFLALARPFTDPTKNADSLVVAKHVVDHLGEQHRLADARPAEQSRLAAALERHQHVDDLDAASRSRTLPNTSNIRDRIPLPTGAFSGPPVSSTVMPRARPCVGESAIPRT
jgi:hypothetical protein